MTWHEIMALVIGIAAIIILGVGSLGLLWGYTAPPPRRKYPPS
jgi:hypothetical protein